MQRIFRTRVSQGIQRAKSFKPNSRCVVWRYPLGGFQIRKCFLGATHPGERGRASEVEAGVSGVQFDGLADIRQCSLNVALLETLVARLKRIRLAPATSGFGSLAAASSQRAAREEKLSSRSCDCTNNRGITSTLSASVIRHGRCRAKAATVAAYPMAQI